MDYLFRTDWQKLFTPQMSLVEVFIRGTMIYVTLCVLMRVVLKRQAGKMSMTDLLVVSIVAGVCRNPLMRDAYSVPDGIAMVVVLLGWGYLLDLLSYYVPAVHRVLHPQPVELIRDGEVKRDNLRRELMTESQLRCQLRQQGVADPKEVCLALLEGGGQVSVICRDGPGHATAGVNGDGTALEGRIAWHERCIAEHREAVREIERALAFRGACRDGEARPG